MSKRAFDLRNHRPGLGPISPSWLCGPRAYEVHRPSSAAASSFNTDRIDHLLPRIPHRAAGPSRLRLHYGDLTDATNLHPHHPGRCSPMRSTNLAAQSHVAVSFETPEYTGQRGCGGDAAHTRSDPHTEFCSSETRFSSYQASTFGNVWAKVREEARSVKTTTRFLTRAPPALRSRQSFTDTGSQ